MSLRSNLIAKVPPVARRDQELARRKERIDRLRGKVGRLERKVARQQKEIDRLSSAAAVQVEEQLARPSYYRQLLTLRRTQVDLRQLDPDLRHPLRHLPFKLRNYRLGASHGIAVPTVLRVWSEAEEIDLAGLPAAFVLKSDGGAGSHGVLPLRRTAGGRLETVDGHRTLTEAEVRDHFVTRAQAGRISGPFFAEELLEQPGGGPIPDDIKIYACYGDVQQVLLRRVGRHGDLRSLRRRYLRADGSDLGDVLVGATTDSTVPVPQNLAEMAQIARHLSRAVGLPFVRVDLFDTADGVVLGEITRSPGGAQRLRPDQDEAMGLAWERASFRLDLDLMDGRPPGILHGSHPAPDLYPAGHVSRSADPGPWRPHVVPCEHWCGQQQE